MSGKSNYLIKRVEFVTKVYIHYREAIMVIMVIFFCYDCFVSLFCTVGRIYVWYTVGKNKLLPNLAGSILQN